jgi:hypothetical protein
MGHQVSNYNFISAITFEFKFIKIAINIIVRSANHIIFNDLKKVVCLIGICEDKRPQNCFL